MPTIYAELVRLLSDVVDQVGLDDTQHGKRVGYMAYTCARDLPLQNFTLEDVFTAGLLHDIGVSSSQELELLVTELNWDHAQLHCVDGAERLSELPFLSKFTSIVSHHHHHWAVLRDNSVLPEEEKLITNLIFMVDRVDALLFQYLFQNPGHEALHAREFIYESLDRLSGYFKPELLQLFFEKSSVDGFWFGLTSEYLSSFVNSFSFHNGCDLGEDVENHLCLLLAKVIDAKSPFTAEHSIRVAALAEFLAEQVGLDRSRCRQVQAAGYVHDIGKLHVPDDVLEKPSKLSEYEAMAMRKHGFEGREILKKLSLFSDIADWACQHHELLDGSGYPFQLKGDEIPIETRILTISDIFQALLQERPYRKPMSLNDVITLMSKLVDAGKIDSQIFQKVVDNPRRCYELATQGA